MRHDLNALGERALEVLQDASERGDVQAARTLADYAMQQHQGKLSVPVQGDVSTMEGVLETAQTITIMTMNGQLQMAEGQKVLTLLHQYASMRAFERIEELAAQLKEFENARNKPSLSLDSDLVPDWFHAKPPGGKQGAKKGKN